MSGPRTISGRCVLIVEDDYFIADEMRHFLETAAAKVLGPAPTIEAALTLLGETSVLDGAVLDLNLRGEMVFPVADALIERGVPFVFATGYEQSAIPARYSDIRRCEKPVEPQHVVEALFP